MKKNYLKFILILILNNILFAQNKYWEIIDSNKMGGDYYFAGIKCADSLNCIERIWVNNNGDMLKITTNGGKSWNNISNYPGYTIQDMVYPDTNLGEDEDSIELKSFTGKIIEYAV